MSDRLKCRVWLCNEKRYLDWEYLRLCADLGDILNRGNTQCQIVEQCTGLKDKNGNLVYEGDVVNYFGKYRRFLYSDCTMEFGLMGDDYSIYGGNIKRFDTYVVDCEIIGNIHEDKIDDTED